MNPPPILRPTQPSKKNTRAAGRFDNALDGAARGLYAVTLAGRSSRRSSGFASAGGAGLGLLGAAGPADPLWGADGLVTVTERPTVAAPQPNTDGVYGVSWMPRVAGTYVFSANYTDMCAPIATTRARAREKGPMGGV
jgi:hypothetical protein